jgi:hypothetical protein
MKDKEKINELMLELEKSKEEQRILREENLKAKIVKGLYK